MKVLRIVPSMNPAQGGVVEAIRQACNYFSSNGAAIDMDVLCLDDPNADWLNGASYNIFALGKGVSPYGINIRYFFWLYRNAKNYDVVILDGLWQFLSWGAYALKILKIRYCVFMHGMLDPYFNENKAKYLKKLPFWFLIERNVIAMADAVIFTCEEEQRLAANSFPLYQSNPVITPLGIELFCDTKENLKRDFYESFPFLRDKCFGLFLSRIHQKKGVDLLIEALPKILEKKSDFYLVIAGPDTNGLAPKLSARAKELKIDENIFFIGMLSGNVKWGAYYASECFLLPSHQENFGIVVAEALSTQTPVLISNKVNIWREIDCEKAGIVKPDTVPGVESQLFEWLSLSPDEKSVMALNAHFCYKNNFSVKTSGESLQAVLESLIKANAGMNSIE